MGVVGSVVGRGGSRGRLGGVRLATWGEGGVCEKVMWVLYSLDPKRTLAIVVIFGRLRQLPTLFFCDH